MAIRIVRPADTPADAYHYWHRRWCEILTERSRAELVAAGLAGASFTERVPDAPDGKGYFSYAIGDEGSVHFMDGEGEAVCEYNTYELGFRLLSDATLDIGKVIEADGLRIISRREKWLALISLLPILRTACHQAIEEAEQKFDLELPKYW
ncbi:MAG: hypothetical protein LC114_13500 [Bryobacterales bacterium]|nr:hypothetical protein [Bryobacterales bacterium]